MAHEIERIKSGYQTLREQEEMWQNSVFYFLKELLEKRPANLIAAPVTADGHRFSLDMIDSNDVVVQIYLSSHTEVVIETNYGYRHTIKEDCYNEFTNEQLNFLCECIGHYFED